MNSVLVTYRAGRHIKYLMKLQKKKQAKSCSTLQITLYFFFIYLFKEAQTLFSFEAFLMPFPYPYHKLSTYFLMCIHLYVKPCENGYMNGTR